MNTDTGEIASLTEEQVEKINALVEGVFKGHTPISEIAPISVGAIVNLTVEGYDPVPCRIEHINVTKQRLSLRPTGLLKMNSNTNPIVRVLKPPK